VPRSPDILVIGAGVIGCAVAYELSRRGAAVHVVDDRLPGMGATQASAGVLAPYIEARHGGPLLELTVRSLDLFDPFVAAVQEDSGTAIEYRRTGTLDTAIGEDGLRHIRETAALLAFRGVAARLLDAPAARDEEPRLSAEVAGALLVPAHGFVAAMGLTHALIAAAVRHGARFNPGTRVRRIHGAAASGALTVETDAGSLSAGSVVMALGSWAGCIAVDGAASATPVSPVRGQLLHLSWRGTPLRRVTWGERCYLVPWQDGTLLVGATVEHAGFDEHTTAAGVRDLIEAACELVPHAWTAGVVAAKAGLRPGTPDDLPLIGRSEALPQLIYAAGHYRNGILLSPLTAQLVADLIVDGRIDPLLDLVSPQRFGRL
jgi:glycine oxidase